MAMRFVVPGDRSPELTASALTWWSRAGREKNTPDLRASSLSQAASLSISMWVLSRIVIRSVKPACLALEIFVISTAPFRDRN